MKLLNLLLCVSLLTSATQSLYSSERDEPNCCGMVIVGSVSIAFCAGLSSVISHEIKASYLNPGYPLQRGFCPPSTKVVEWVNGPTGPMDCLDSRLPKLNLEQITQEYCPDFSKLGSEAQKMIGASAGCPALKQREKLEQDRAKLQQPLQKYFDHMYEGARDYQQANVELKQRFPHNLAQLALAKKACGCKEDNKKQK